MADCSLPDWHNLSDDSSYVYEALRILGFYGVDFSNLSTAEMRDVLAVALYLKVKQGRETEVWES